MKKRIMLLLCIIASSSLVSCSTTGYEPSYTVIWQNYNGDILEIDRNVKEGTLPSYNGAEPSRKGNSYTGYQFNGWDKDIVEVYENTTYTATYIKGEKTYKVIWQNYDGNVLEIDEKVPHGTIPTYNGEVPTRDQDEKNSYVFSGWTPEVNEATQDITYVARYTEVINTYKVTWLNYDGNVLEIDENVPYGTMPSYDSDTPVKNGESTKYIFSGWSPKIDVVTEETTYTATFIELNDSNYIPGINPVISSDGKTVEYGFYPQTHVNDSTLINELETLTPSVNNWVMHNGEFYTKQTAKVYNNEIYTFDDSVSIVQNQDYWFKCETIKWNILDVNNGKYYLLSSKLLDTSVYYKDYNDRMNGTDTIYSNNYENSDIRSWLNNEFYNTAFALNNTYINKVNVDNSSSTTEINNNAYCSNNTEDKVYLPSYQDYLNSYYGFSSELTIDKYKEAKTTDYTRVRGAWCNVTSSLKYNGSYWTRSPSSKYYYVAWNVNSSGYLSEYAVDRNNHCVRPCMTIDLQ